MPGGDRTGPLGAGPMTGRVAGFCAGYNTAGYVNNLGRGGGLGRGRGFGGRPNRPYNQYAEQTSGEANSLKQMAELIRDSLSQISERLERLEKKDAK